MPFKPKYTITNTILSNISRIVEGREFIEHSRLIPKWEMKLKKEARVHNAHSSTSIEGNRLTLDQVKALSEHKDVIASDKDKNEVINYLKALDKIPNYAAKNKIDTPLLLQIHKLITKDTLKEKKHSGDFRDRQVFVGKRVFDGTGFKEVVEYMPPQTKDVPRLVEEFLEWLSSTEAKKINPVLLAGVAHYEIARIHPFVDGNGRTARLLAALILYKSGFDHRRFFALDDHYDEDRSAYYAALKAVQEDKGDITRWLEYFTNGVLNSIAKVKETILKIGVGYKIEEGEKIELSTRQIRILEKIREKGKITNKELRGMFSVSRQAILKEINKLIEAKIIEIIGKGRGAYYKISED
ncbi:MAG: Fic family protein [Candidatus Omnitrophica bacterium]|nr:Fic family protein [Candidatus Omnitrophota bacterium]